MAILRKRVLSQLFLSLVDTGGGSLGKCGSKSKQKDEYECCMLLLTHTPPLIQLPFLGKTGVDCLTRAWVDNR